jgi:hypothetical protein
VGKNAKRMEQRKQTYTTKAYAEASQTGKTNKSNDTRERKEMRKNKFNPSPLGIVTPTSNHIKYNGTRQWREKIWSQPTQNRVENIVRQIEKITSDIRGIFDGSLDKIRNKNG